MNGQKVDQSKIDEILAAIRLAPTSNGLQPYKVVVIQDQTLKEKIQPIAYNQTQIVDSAALFVFAAWDNYTEERINNVMDYTVAQRGLPTGTLDEYKQTLIGQFASLTPEESWAHAARQAYIGLGVGVTAAALNKVDATPMEGFVNDKLDELLDLQKYGVKSAALLAIGYRDEDNDWLVNLKKVRTPEDEFFIHL